MTETKQYVGHKYKLDGMWSRCRFTLETVDHRDLKSIIYTVKFYYQGDKEYYHTVVDTLFKATKRIVSGYMDDAIFNKDFISCPYIPEIPQNGPTFTQFEFTLYPKGKIKSDTAMEMIFTTLSDRIHKDLFKDNLLVRSKK
jgi:hypothetical protein